MPRDIRTLLGFGIILGGFVLTGWAVWYLATVGDIIQIIHELKMGLPGWAWKLLRFSLTAVAGLTLLAFFVILGVLAFGMDKRR
jgi:hypothetical protein